MSSLCVGLEIQCDLEGRATCSRRTHDLEHVFLVVFILELLIRVFGDGSSILKSGWFRFDASLVALGVISAWVIEPIVLNVMASDGSVFIDVLSKVLILRVLRLLRLVRALRLFEQFQEMWKLANGLVCSLRTVLSACVMIVLTIYIFACLGIELITKNKFLLEDPETAALIQSHFPSLQMTMLTLVQFANADSIADVYKPIVEKSWHLIFYFGFVWLVVTIKLMNLITAVISRLRQGDVDRDLELAMKRKRWRVLEPVIRDTYRELDQNATGELSLSAFRYGLDNMKTAYKKSLPIDLRKILDSDQLVELYEYLDVDRSGAIDEKEFTDGIFTLMLQSIPIETTQMLHMLRSNTEALQRIQRRLPGPGQSPTDATVAAGRLEQARFAVAERERQLGEKADALSKKDAEVKSLLRQLAAVGDSGVVQAEAATASQAEEEACTAFEVMFALEGALGLEFQRLQPPYVVQQVHGHGVAVGLGILPGDELLLVAEQDVTQTPWEDLVKQLGQRPVVARFRRDPRRELPEREEVGGLFEAGIAGVSRGASLLTQTVGRAAISVVPGVPGRGGASPGGGPGTGEAPAEGQHRLLAEVERLGTLLRARDGEVADLGDQLRQRDEALRVLEAGDAALAGAAKMAKDAEASAQRARQAQERLQEMESQVAALRAEREAAAQRLSEETAQKEEYRQQASALTERCNSLMAQFETLRGTFLNPQQKAEMEARMQELMRMNAQWQQAHQSLSADAESLRQQAVEKNQLQSEVDNLQHLERAVGMLQARLQEAEGQLEEVTGEAQQLREMREADQGTIQRLQAVVESVQESGDSQAGWLEAELMERSRECQALRREAEKLRSQVEELARSQEEGRQTAEEGRALREANDGLSRELEASKKDREELNGVLQRCLAKLEKEGMERPHLVDKRMVTQMLASYLEQRDNPRQSQ
ncbi:unnamed protein product, partial [Prorocentrum cordatum]